MTIIAVIAFGPKFECGKMFVSAQDVKLQLALQIAEASALNVISMDVTRNVVMNLWSFAFIKKFRPTSAKTLLNTMTNMVLVFVHVCDNVCTTVFD